MCERNVTSSLRISGNGAGDVSAQRADERWRMDFVHDQLFDGRRFRVLTVVDQFSRKSPLLEGRFSFRGSDVVELLEELVAEIGTPLSITVDHGTEFTSKALEEWAYRNGVKLDFTHPGKPTDSAHIESFNGRFRDECLNVIQLVALNDAASRSSAGANRLQRRASAQLAGQPDTQRVF
jgi:putative transposase